MSLSLVPRLSFASKHRSRMCTCVTDLAMIAQATSTLSTSSVCTLPPPLQLVSAILAPHCLTKVSSSLDYSAVATMIRLASPQFLLYLHAYYCLQGGLIGCGITTACGLACYSLGEKLCYGVDHLGSARLQSFLDD